MRLHPRLYKGLLQAAADETKTSRENELLSDLLAAIALS